MIFQIQSFVFIHLMLWIIYSGLSANTCKPVLTVQRPRTYIQYSKYNILIIQCSVEINQQNKNPDLIPQFISLYDF